MALVHVEILLRPECVESNKTIIAAVEKYQHNIGFELGSEKYKFSDPVLNQNVLSISTSNHQHTNENGYDIRNGLKYHYHVYKLYDLEAADEMLENGDDKDLPAASHLMLPSTNLQGLWETLKFDTDIKNNLLRYIETILFYADKGVDSNLISCNRVVLLHGPPGTGKTSLCKALAQKICIRLSHRFQQGSLLEINSHSLFSKWFSESGNLVRKMFAKIEELVQDGDSFVCVLIDEVESLTCARASHDSGTEPSDSIRVVNALLTQIDKIKEYPNVVIMTTSNVTGKLDMAFVDRADIKQYIGLPSVSAIYEILRSCILELIRVNVIFPRQYIHPFDWVHPEDVDYENKGYSEELKRISKKCSGLSGRALRKLPFITQAMFIEPKVCTMKVFLSELSKAVDLKFQELKDLAYD
ncbi:pachytene checkpoint protein 2 homolog [Styela clava]